MIQRIVLIKLTAEYGNAADRKQVAAQSTEVLAAVPGVLEISAGAPADVYLRPMLDKIRVWNFSLAGLNP